jgi:hypothetical protein
MMLRLRSLVSGCRVWRLGLGMVPTGFHVAAVRPDAFATGDLNEAAVMAAFFVSRPHLRRLCFSEFSKLPSAGKLLIWPLQAPKADLRKNNKFVEVRSTQR